jgi:hypothetical protein
MIYLWYHYQYLFYKLYFYDDHKNVQKDPDPDPYGNYLPPGVVIAVIGVGGMVCDSGHRGGGGCWWRNSVLLRSRKFVGRFIAKSNFNESPSLKGEVQGC